MKHFVKSCIDKDFKSRDDWRFYHNVIDNWEGQEYLYAVDLINKLYIRHLQRAVLAYSKAEDKYYSPEGIASDMKCPRIEDFGISRGEYFYMLEGNIKILLNKNIKSDDLEDYVEY